MDLHRVPPERLGGDALLACKLNAPDRTVIDCKVIKEVPKGEGFGEKAKMIAEMMERISTTNIDQLRATGDPVEGAKVLVPVSFRIKDNTGPAAAAPPKDPAQPAVSAAAPERR